MRFISILVILAIFLVIPAVYAEVQYPVQELGNCASQQDCEKYCDDIQNVEVCINFAEKAGMMTKDQIDEAKRMIPYLKSGETPGKCTSEKQCDEYCNKDENLQECISFAEKAGLISGEELAMVKKTGGKGPGGCKGKKQCDEFCNNEANFPTCVDFAVANGMMDAKDAEMAKKTGGKGPGNCKSKEECDAFCNNPDNQETCMNFAIEHGLMSEADLANMKKNQEFMNSAEGKCQMQCLKDAGVDSKACGENGNGPEACRGCADKCFPHDNEKCLNQERWQQLDTDCKAKGSGYYLEEVKGDDGYGKECVIDETCVYSSDSQWESQEEKDRQLAEMQKQWDEERAQYESDNGPGGSSNEGGSGGSGGCTQPGPEGQCNPGPGAGPEPGSDSGGSSGGSDSSGSSSDDGGTGQAGVTGRVIMKTNTNSEGIIPRLIEYVRNLF